MQSIIKSARVTLGSRPVGPAGTVGSVEPKGPLPGRTAPEPARCEKTVRLLDTHGLATAIEVVCSCGEITLVELDCPPPGGSPQEPSL